MKLHILGCGDAFGSGGRNNSGYLIESGEKLFLLDCGPTTLLAMKRAGFSPGRLDAVFLSHLHGDHCGGLPFFFIDYLYEHPRECPLHIAGPEQTEDRVRGFFSGCSASAWNRESFLRPSFTSSRPAGRNHRRHRSLSLPRTASGARRLARPQNFHSGKPSSIPATPPGPTSSSRMRAAADLFLCECCFFERDTPIT